MSEGYRTVLGIFYDIIMVCELIFKNRNQLNQTEMCIKLNAVQPSLFMEVLKNMYIDIINNYILYNNFSIIWVSKFKYNK